MITCYTEIELMHFLYCQSWKRWTKLHVCKAAGELTFSHSAGKSTNFLKAIWQYRFKKNQKLKRWIFLIWQSSLLANCPKEIIGQIHKSEITESLLCCLFSQKIRRNPEKIIWIHCDIYKFRNIMQPLKIWHISMHINYPLICKATLLSEKNIRLQNNMLTISSLEF